ncbi:MAG: hypothetical protein LUO89_06785 [Methanothrix sp.]|nr:hypothetical protein [Methanothrix sp.]
MAIYLDSINAQVDNDKYYHLGSMSEEIQISENEMASDPDRHRSLNKYRRVSYAGITTIAPQFGHIERGFFVPDTSIFSHAGHAVII